MSTTPTTKPCFPHRHMSAAEYGFWDVARSLSHDTNVLYFSGAKFAERFGSMSKSTAYAIADRLKESGWLKLEKESFRKTNGCYTPTYYRVLSHEEWAAEHPGECDKPVQILGLDEKEPVQISNSPVQISNSPVQILGTNLCKQSDVSKPRTQSDNLGPVLDSGLATTNFLTRFGQGHRRRPSQPPNATAPILEGQPVPNSGLAVLDTQRQAFWLLDIVRGKIPLTRNQSAEWETSLKALLGRGHSVQKIKEVIDFTHGQMQERMRYAGGIIFARDFDKMSQSYDESLQERRTL